MTNDNAVLVTYRRRKSGRTHQIQFHCGEENGRLILMEAWNTNSTIVVVEPTGRAEHREDGR